MIPLASVFFSFLRIAVPNSLSRLRVYLFQSSRIRFKSRIELRYQQSAASICFLVPGRISHYVRSSIFEEAPELPGSNSLDDQVMCEFPSDSFDVGIWKAWPISFDVGILDHRHKEEKTVIITVRNIG